MNFNFMYYIYKCTHEINESNVYKHRLSSEHFLEINVNTKPVQSYKNQIDFKLVKTLLS